MSEAYGIENGSVQWPFVVAATIFLMEFLLCFLLLLLLRLMLYFKDPGSGEVLFLSRLREVAEMLACISFFSGVYYVFQVCRKHDHDLPMGSASWFRDTREIREGRHMILWTFLAPQQWVAGPGATRIHFRWPGDARTAVYQSQLARSQQLDDLDSLHHGLWPMCFAGAYLDRASLAGPLFLHPCLHVPVDHLCKGSSFSNGAGHCKDR